MDKKQIVVVGGGITGLSAAYYLQQRIKKEKLPYEVKLVEASGRLGGKIKTVKKDGYTIELGPDSLPARKPAAMKLTRELGLEEQMVYNATGQSYILANNKLHKMPLGTFMGIPKDRTAIVSTKLISFKGKIRALGDLVIPKSEPKADLSLGQFMRRRFGNEIVDNLISPLLSGIHSGDIDKMSLMATFPNFYHLEQKYGSIMKGLQKSMPGNKKQKGKRPGGMFFSFADGLESFVHRLEENLDEGSVLINTAVDHIERKASYYHVLLSNGNVLKSDAVVIATPHTAVPKMFSQYPFFQLLHDIPMTSTANVVLAFDEKAMKQTVEGTGFQVARNSNYRITACTWTNKKWPTTTPEGKVLLRCYVGRPSDQEIVELGDEEIVRIVLEDLQKQMEIKGDPDFTIVTRYIKERPQYNVGHLDLVNRVRQDVAANLPGLFLIGSSYDGAGIPDCIQHGENVVQEVFDYLQ